jgi:Protein of unknown function (DUF1761)
MSIEFNWPAVALAALSGLVLHLIWFSPYVLGGLWQRLEKLSDADLKAGLLPRLGLATLVCAAQSLCLAGFMNFTQSNTFLMGVLAALQLGIGLAGPAIAMVLVMGRRPAGLIGIYLGWLLLSQAMAGGILASWKF